MYIPVYPWYITCEIHVRAFLVAHPRLEASDRDFLRIFSVLDTDRPNNVNAITAAAAKEKGQISLLPIRYGAPSILGKKCQGIYIYIVYVAIMLVYNMYMSVIYHVYVCDILYIYMD